MLIKDKLIWVLFIAVLLEAFFVSFDLVHKYNNFTHYNKPDLADHIQQAWNTGRGRWLVVTKPYAYGIIEITAFLGHFQPIYLFIGLWYSIFPHPLSIMWLQTFFVLSGAIPVYLIADNLLKDKISAMMFSFIYLIYFPLFVIMQYFHAGHLSMPFIFFAFYYLQTRNLRMFTLFSILAMSCREEIALIVFMFGAYAFIKRMDKIWVVAPLLMGAFWFAMFLAFTRLLQWHSVYDIPHAHFGVHYGYLGSNYFEIIKNIISNPTIIYDQLSSPRTVNIIKDLLSRLYYLPLLSPSTLFIGSISFSEILLSNSPIMGSLSGQPWYLCWNIPIIIVSLIYAASNLNKFATYILPSLENGSGLISFISISIFIAIIVTNQSKPVTPYVKNFFNDRFWSLNDEQKDTWNIIKSIPKEASIMTNFKLLPPLAARRLRMTANHFGTKIDIIGKKHYDYMLLIRNKEFSRKPLAFLANNPDYGAVLYNDNHALYRHTKSQSDGFVDWRKKAAAHILENTGNKNLVAVDNWENLKTIIGFLCAPEDNTRDCVTCGYEKSKKILDQYFTEICSLENVNLIKNGAFEAEHKKVFAKQIGGKYGLIVLEETPSEGWRIAPLTVSSSRIAKFGGTALFLQPKDYLQSIGYKIRTDDTDFTNSRVNFGVWARSEDTFKIVSLRLLLNNPEQGWRVFQQTFERVSPEWKFYFITTQFEPSYAVKELYAYVTPSNLLNGESFNEIYIDGMTAAKGLWTDYKPITIQIGMKQISFIVVKEETKYLEELLDKYGKIFFISESSALPDSLKKYFKGKVDILTGAKSRKMSSNSNWLNWINIRLPEDLQIIGPALYEIE